MWACAARCDAAESVGPSPVAPKDGEPLSLCRVQGEDGRGGGLRRTHRFVLPRRMCGGSGIMRECSTSSTAFCTQFRTTSWSFCASVRPSPLEEEVGLGTREPGAPNMRSRLAAHRWEAGSTAAPAAPERQLSAHFFTRTYF